VTPAGLAALSSIFMVSLLGSWHCGLMCGGFSMSLTQGLTSRLIHYHLGRMISYTLMGGLAGALGRLALSAAGDYKFLVAGLIGTLLVLGVTYNLFELFAPSHRFQWLERFSKIQNLKLERAMKWAYSKPYSSSILGALSVFLPCGWLYGFLMAAVASGSFLAGALTLFVFWLGGLPSLTVGSIYLRKSFQKISPQWQPFLQIVVLTSTLFSLISFYI